MKSLCIIVALVAFIAIAQAEDATSPSFDKLIADAYENIDAGAKKLKEANAFASTFDKAKVKTALDNGFQQSKKKFDESIESLKAVANNEKVTEAANNLSNYFNNIAKNVNQHGSPDDIKKHDDNFAKGMKEYVQKLSDIAKSAGANPSPDVQNAIKNLIQDAISGAKSVQTVVQDAINEAQKKSSA